MSGKKGKLALLLMLTLFACLAFMRPAETSGATAAKLTTTFKNTGIDKHGHIKLSLTCDEIMAAGYQYGDILKVRFLGRTLKVPLCANYTDIDAGKPAVIAGKNYTHVRLAINYGCFAETYKIAEKILLDDGNFEWNYAEGVTGPVKVTISLKKAGAYLDEFNLRQIESSKERKDYPELTDKEFVNFREVTTTGMGSGVLYRTSSPINPSNKRNKYADEALKEAGVSVILNLADDEATARGYEGFGDSYYSTTAFLCLDMTVGVNTSEFESKLAKGLKFMAANPGIYAIHCKEGKDRAGYVTALLECFMGATYEEVVADYMTTYYNYYKITSDDPGYEAIMNGNIVQLLKKTFTFSKKDKKKDLSTRNLAKCAEKYFLKIGLTKAETAQLRANLSRSFTGTGTAGSEVTRIKVFETTDIHGYIFDASKGQEELFQYRLPYIAGVVGAARKSGEYDDILLVDGGDIYQGTPVSNLTYGAPMIAAFDVMGYDAVVLGNHEFDWDVEKYATDAEGTLPAYSIGSFSGDPDIPVLASDLYYADSDDRTGFTGDYVVVEKAGKRIALIGYIPDYHLSIMSSKIAPYSIKDDLKAFSKRVKQINKKEKPDVTIVIAHQDPLTVAEGLSKKDVDLVAGGHTHVGMYGIAATGIPFIQGYYYANGYASALIVIDGDGNVRVEEPSYISITGDVTQLYDNAENLGNFDSTVLEIAHESWMEIGDKMSEVLGYIDTPVLKAGVVSDNGATSAGNWITGLMLRRMKEYGVVAAFYNTGGIRTSFEIPEGETRRNITVGDIYSINPFNNFWLVYELTGAELKQQLINGFILKNYGDQMSGLTFEYINHGTAKEPDIEILSITLDDGTEVDINDTETTYRVCTTNFSGTVVGSVFENKTSVISEGEAPVDNVTLIELLREEAGKNKGYISVDTSERGMDAGAEEELDDAA